MPLLPPLAALSVVAALSSAPRPASAAPVTSGTPVQVWPCAPGSPRQAWSVVHGGSPGDNVRLGGAGGQPVSGLVLNTLGYDNSTGGVLNVWTDALGTPWGQQWGLVAGQLVSETNGLCAGTSNASGPLPAGTPVVQVPCASGATATWALNASDGHLVWAADPTLCLDAGTTTSCADPLLGRLPLCNASLPPAARAADALSRMLPAEKAAFLAVSNNGVPRLGVPRLSYGEALHGVLSGCGARAPPVPGFASTGCATSFPTALALGASFNRTLWHAIGAVIGTEGRALFNQGVAQSMYFTPNVNPCRYVRGRVAGRSVCCQWEAARRLGGLLATRTHSPHPLDRSQGPPLG